MFVNSLMFMNDIVSLVTISQIFRIAGNRYPEERLLATSD